MQTIIESIRAREILDSRGNPTLEVDVVLVRRRDAAGPPFHPALRPARTRPSSCATATKSATAARASLKAVGNVNDEIAEAVVGLDALDQRAIDQTMIELDGTPNKGRLGANAILGVSLAVARAAASFSWSAALSLSRRTERAHVAGADDEHPQWRQARAGSSVDMQEFMVMPIGARVVSRGPSLGRRVFHTLKKLLADSAA